MIDLWEQQRLSILWRMFPVLPLQAKLPSSWDPRELVRLVCLTSLPTESHLLLKQTYLVTFSSMTRFQSTRRPSRNTVVMSSRMMYFSLPSRWKRRLNLQLDLSLKFQLKSKTGLSSRLSLISECSTFKTVWSVIHREKFCQEASVREPPSVSNSFQILLSFCLMSQPLVLTPLKLEVSASCSIN